MNDKRDRWPSRTMFIFAAVGSAVGLGNVWRFPYLVGKYGGGAFLFPYLIALFLVGFPLLVMEFAIGLKMQQGAVGAMRKIDRRLSGIGLGAVLSAFGVSCYYAVVMSWCILYAFYSVNLAWGADTKTFFFQNVIQASASANQIEGFAIPVVLALIASWVMIYFCIWKGVKSVSTVVQVTMPLPIILLLILLVRTLFLPGAWDGVVFFFQPNFAALLDLDIWMAAITQIFFTLTLGFGVMITYASYLPKKSDIVKNALIIAIADVAIALTAGFVVFTTIGNMAQTSGESIADLAASGPSLAFVVLPRALSMIPGAAILSVIFFIMLITLAIDSQFSLVEAVAAVFEDMFPKISKKMIVFFVCLAGFIGGLVFTTSAGIFYLDIVDHFITNYGLVLMGLFQTIAIGWVYGPEKLRQFANEVSEIHVGKSWNFMIKYFIPISLTAIIGQTFYNNIVVPYGGHPEWAVWSLGWGLVAFILIAGAAFSYFQVKNNHVKKKEMAE